MISAHVHSDSCPICRLVHLQHLALIQLRIEFMDARKISGSGREYVDFFAFYSSYGLIFASYSFWSLNASLLRETFSDRGLLFLFSSHHIKSDSLTIHVIITSFQLWNIDFTWLNKRVFIAVIIFQSLLCKFVLFDYSLHVGFVIAEMIIYMYNIVSFVGSIFLKL